MLRFEYASIIDAPVETVWQFYERPDILNRLTPPWQPVEVIRREGGLGIGAISEFRLHLGPITIPWIAKHTECEPYQYFVDSQTQGPMQSWTHRHLFIQQENKTRLVDRIEYELPGGTPTEFVLGWWVDSRLKEMFRYRHEVTQNFCQGK